MNDLAAELWSASIWTVNGLLVIVYYCADHILVIAIAITVTLFAAYTPKEQRVWAAGAAVLAILASFAAPMPAPVLLLVMAVSGWVAQFLEKYNRPAQRWNTIRGLILYALAGLGYTAVIDSGMLNTTSLTNPMLAQASGYINTILTIAMFVIPLGFLAMLAQSITALPPAPGSPEELISKVRTRGKN